MMLCPPGIVLGKSAKSLMVGTVLSTQLVAVDQSALPEELSQWSASTLVVDRAVPQAARRRARGRGVVSMGGSRTGACLRELIREAEGWGWERTSGPRNPRAIARAHPGAGIGE